LALVGCDMVHHVQCTQRTTGRTGKNPCDFDVAALQHARRRAAVAESYVRRQFSPPHHSNFAPTRVTSVTGVITQVAVSPSHEAVHCLNSSSPFGIAESWRGWFGVTM